MGDNTISNQPLVTAKGNENDIQVNDGSGDLKAIIGLKVLRNGFISASGFVGDGGLLSNVGGGSGVPGGSVNSIQYNAGASTFGGSSNFTFDGTNVSLSGGGMFSGDGGLLSNVGSGSVQPGTVNQLGYYSGSTQISNTEGITYSAADNSLAISGNLVVGNTVKAVGGYFSERLTIGSNVLNATTNLYVTGNLYADRLYGDGSNLTGISGGTQTFEQVVARGNVTSNTVQFTNASNALAVTSVNAAIAFTSNVVITAGDGSKISIGQTAVSTTQGDRSISIGSSAGSTNQGISAIAIGTFAGNLTQRVGSIGIGDGAGRTSQGSHSVAIGYFSGSAAQASGATAVGGYAGQTSQGLAATALGFQSGFNAQASYAVAVGWNAGSNNQGQSGIGIGKESARTNQGSNALAVGNSAGSNAQGTNAVAVGLNAGTTAQGTSAVAIGVSAGLTSQGLNAVAIGNSAGSNRQGSYSVAIGPNAGSQTQNIFSVAIGSSAGCNVQGSYAVAIGTQAGSQAQNAYSVSLGYQAGQTNQGSYSIAIGNQAASTNQHANSILLNATALETNTLTSNAFYVNPVRLATSSNVMFYNVVSKEVSYGSPIGTTLQMTTDSGNTTSNTIQFTNQAALHFVNNVNVSIGSANGSLAIGYNQAISNVGATYITPIRNTDVFTSNVLSYTQQKELVENDNIVISTNQVAIGNRTFVNLHTVSCNHGATTNVAVFNFAYPHVGIIKADALMVENSNTSTRHMEWLCKNIAGTQVFNTIQAYGSNTSPYGITNIIVYPGKDDTGSDNQKFTVGVELMGPQAGASDVTLSLETVGYTKPYIQLFRII
jgi:hypothetical protein